MKSECFWEPSPPATLGSAALPALCTRRLVVKRDILFALYKTAGLGFVTVLRAGGLFKHELTLAGYPRLSRGQWIGGPAALQKAGPSWCFKASKTAG